jgi:hypothetical protein
MVSLQPSDVAIALDLALGMSRGSKPTPPPKGSKSTSQTRGRPAQADSLAALARRVGLSLGQVHNALKRLQAARLLIEPRQINRRALYEFVTHGVRYVFPGVLGGITRGVPTAHAGPGLAEIFGDVDPVVWPSSSGTTRGESLEPLYPAALRLVGSNPPLYCALTLVDAIRVGRARERAVASSQLAQLLGLQSTGTSGTA